jgi:hypothetical protein
MVIYLGGQFVIFGKPSYEKAVFLNQMMAITQKDSELR